MVGGGGREHAIAWKLKADDPSLELIAAPGNPGIAELADCVPVAPTDVLALEELAIQRRADLTVVGPEGPLAAGIADTFREHGLKVFGPSAAAARIESSKRFAKELMLEAGVPTAAATWHSDVESAKTAVRLVGAPVVVKASGLAAGKGVVVCQTVDAADRAIEAMLQEHAHGASGDEILVEEFMQGEELSVFVLTDGSGFLTMLPAQDHKRLQDGDHGPNTGGMGAYAPVSISSDDLIRRVETEIIEPMLLAMKEHGSLFQGLLYCGIMLTADGPKVVEFNCRFGDPETQVVLPLLRSPLLEYLLRSSEPDGMVGAPPLDFLADSAITTVVAAPGYPDSPRTGAPVQLPVSREHTLFFHAGTRRDESGSLVTAGGRVAAVTGIGQSFAEARNRSLEGAELVVFPDRQFRRDIGWREAERRAGTA